MRRRNCKGPRGNSRGVYVPLSTPRDVFAGLTDAGAMISLWMGRVRQRRALAELDDRLLHDIGLTRIETWPEINKPFWRR